MNQISKDLLFAIAMQYMYDNKYSEATKIFIEIGDTAMAQWAHFKIEVSSRTPKILNAYNKQNKIPIKNNPII